LGSTGTQLGCTGTQSSHVHPVSQKRLKRFTAACV